VDRFKVTYVANGTTLTDVVEGTDGSYQRNDMNLVIMFGGGDGRFVTQFSKPVQGSHEPVLTVSYARCERMTRHWVEPDTSTKLS